MIGTSKSVTSAHDTFGAMKIVLAGGTGQIGAILERAFAGDEVVVLSRSGAVRWDGRTLGPWAARARGRGRADQPRRAQRRLPLHRANRREIMVSRLESTRVLREAIERAADPPRVWLQSSTATIYADNYGAAERRGRRARRRRAGPAGHLALLDRRRARAGRRRPRARRVRTVLMRSAMVMSPDRGGVFDTLRTLVRRGLGGRAGSGRQYVSWIHDDDFAERDHAS